jgi:hypothetical protein
MNRFTVAINQEFEADTAEEAALLMYQALAKRPPLSYAVTDETDAVFTLTLDPSKADEFAKTDQTADPGNW